MEVLLNQGQSVGDFCRSFNISEQTYYRLAGDGLWELISPARRRQTDVHALEVFEIFERRVCRALEQPRSTQRYRGQGTDDEEMLTPGEDGGYQIVLSAMQIAKQIISRVTS